MPGVRIHLAHLAALLLPLAAVAQPYKCTIGGQAVYQQAPCPTTATQQRAVDVRGGNATAAPAVVVPASATAAAQGGGTVEQRMLAKSERERRISAVTTEIAAREQAIAQRNAQMEYEIARLQYRQNSARNNLAGATYHSSLSTEMQAVAMKYRTMNEADMDRLRVLRTELAKLPPP